MNALSKLIVTKRLALEDKLLGKAAAKQKAAEKDVMLLLPVDTALAAYPAITVSAAQAARFGNGGALDMVRLRTKVEGTVRVCDPDGNCIALGTPADGMLKMTCLLQV